MPRMKTLRAYLQLCRAPALFTALADILLGSTLARSEWVPVSKLVWLLGASAGLYLSGMVWNDIFDREQDTRERPQRPIPSGRVPLRSAVVFASILMLTGLLCAAVAGLRSFAIAALLTCCILLYDGVLKKTVLGPCLMGGCRFFNVILGASTAGSLFSNAWQMPQLWVATCLGIYIMGVTWFARTEALISRRGVLVFAAGVINTGLLGLAAWIGGWSILQKRSIGPGAIQNPQMVLLALAMIAVTINRRIIVAIVSPHPNTVQSGVRMMLLSVIMLDAVSIYYQWGDSGMNTAIATACLVIPSLLFGKWMSMT